MLQGNTNVRLPGPFSSHLNIKEEKAIWVHETKVTMVFQYILYGEKSVIDQKRSDSSELKGSYTYNQACSLMVAYQSIIVAWGKFNIKKILSLVKYDEN